MVISIRDEHWTGPPLSEGQRAASCCMHCVELAGIEVFKYPSMLWDSAFPRRRQHAFLHCTLISPLQGQTLARPTGSPLSRREGREETPGSTCPGMLKLFGSHQV